MSPLDRIWKRETVLEMSIEIVDKAPRKIPANAMVELKMYFCMNEYDGFDFAICICEVSNILNMCLFCQN